MKQWRVVVLGSSALVLVLGGIVVATVPFSSRIDAPEIDSGGSKDTLVRIQIDGRCSPPIVSAWRSPGSYDKVHLALVTVETEHSSFEARGGLGRWCAPAARRRLAGGAAGTVIGLVMGAIAFRRHRAWRRTNALFANDLGRT